MPIHIQLSPLLRRLWGNVWVRLPERDKAYIGAFPLAVEQFREPQPYLGRVLWRENNLVVTLAAQIPDGTIGHYVIAHELGHVALYHPLLSWLPAYAGWSETVEPLMCESRELMVDALVFAWGFDQEIGAAIRAGLVRNPALTQFLEVYSSRVEI